MTLHLNTADLTCIKFTLVNGKDVIAQYSQDMPPHSTHLTLPHLEKFLAKAGYAPQNPTHTITKISLYKGEGSPTGLRLGSAIAQALSLAWNVPLSLTNKMY